MHLLIHLLTLLLPLLPSKARLDPWTSFTNCRLVSSDANDGDSFHVQAGGRERIFRLYFVDAPEIAYHPELRSRITSQARYWKINRPQLYRIAEEARQVILDLLKEPFSITTRWEDAKGASRLPRYFAVVSTSKGDLAELLVSQGLARIHGHYMDHPNGTKAKLYRKKLSQLEAQARRLKKGAWREEI